MPSSGPPPGAAISASSVARAAAAFATTRGRRAPGACRATSPGSARLAAARARDAVHGSLDQLDRRVALRAASVAAVGALLGEVDDDQVLALAADGEAAPEPGAARLSPADAQLLGREVARGALVGDDRAH